MPLAQILQSRHDTTVIDLPGFGESDLPDKEWGVEEYAAIVEEAIRTLGLNRPVFFGHSFGGSIGIYLAATHKNIFSKLVLCDASFKRSPAKSSFIGAVLRKLPVHPASCWRSAKPLTASCIPDPTRSGIHILNPISGRSFQPTLPP
jgi:pimeloyl-ACP methyl ester carboxylesterase